MKLSISRIIVPVIILIFSGLVFHACVKDELDFDRFSTSIELGPGIIAPVGYGSLSISDLLRDLDNEGLLREYSDGLLYLAYQQQMVSVYAEDIINVPTQFHNQFFFRSEIESPAMPPEGVVLEKDNHFVFDFEEGEEIDSVKLKSGALVFETVSSFLHTGELEIVSPSITTSGGTPLNHTILISDASGSFYSYEEIDISGHTLSFDNADDSTSILIHFQLTLQDSGNPLRDDDTVRIGMTFRELEFSIVYGNIGNKTFLNEAGSLEIEVFNLEEGNIEFSAPRLFIIVDNSYGVPISFELSDLNSISDRTGESIDITFTEGNPIPIDFPSINQIGDVAQTIFTFETIDPTISEVIDTDPNILNYTARAFTDLGRASKSNFLLDTSHFNAQLEIELPLWLRAGNFVLRDTIDFDLSEMLDSEEEEGILEELTIWFTSENGLPVNSRLQVYFVDDNFQTIDSLFISSDEYVLESGILGPDERVIEKTIKTTEVNISSERLNKWDNVQNAIIKARITTTDFDEDTDLKVKFFSDYELEFNLSVKAKLKITSD